MKTLQTIYNKLNSVEKTELETHKVEFALVGDIAKIKQSFLKNMQQSNKAFDKVRDSAMDLNQIVNKIEKNSSDADSLMKKIKTTAKELGVSIKDIEGADMLENISEGTEAKALKSKVQKIVSAL
tara:strand:+ start:540 stop:914 length:375 start_codon:yes stop_codon:yes gene_type:complete